MRLDAKRLTDASARWVGALDPADRVGVTTTSGLGPNVPLTTNRAAAVAALRGRFPAQKPPLLDTTRFRIDDVIAGIGNGRARTRLNEAIPECSTTRGAGGPPPMDQDACEIEASREVMELGYLVERTAIDQIEAYTRLVRQLERMPSPRILVLISDGLPLTGGTGYATTFRRLAAEAGVQLFALTFDVAPENRLSEEVTEVYARPAGIDAAGRDQPAPVPLPMGTRSGTVPPTQPSSRTA